MLSTVGFLFNTRHKLIKKSRNTLKQKCQGSQTRNKSVLFLFQFQNSDIIWRFTSHLSRIKGSYCRGWVQLKKEFGEILLRVCEAGMTHSEQMLQDLRCLQPQSNLLPDHSPTLRKILHIPSCTTEMCCQPAHAYLREDSTIHHAVVMSNNTFPRYFVNEWYRYLQVKGLGKG